MKKFIAKIIIPFFAAAVLIATPVVGAPLSGAELLERFDKLYAATAAHEPIILSDGGYISEPDQDEISFYEDEDADFDIIIIIDDDPGYESYEYAGEEPDYGRHGGYEDNGGGYAVPLGGGYPKIAPVGGFAITSGINVRSESTFDTARTIVGAAPRGAVVRIEIFGYHSDSDTFYQVSGSVLTVGASGNFSSAQQLAVGRNFIRIKAAYYDSVSGEPFVSIKTAQLNRLPNEIRNQLERGFLLP